jgi:hypothetical protein
MMFAQTVYAALVIAEKHGVLGCTKQKVLRLRANDLVFRANDDPSPCSQQNTLTLWNNPQSSILVL